MPLKEDQRAMLQLLLERDQSYEDIGSLLGLETEEVRARARAALTEMGGADPDAEVGLTDYLLGQADPIGRADAVRHLGGDEEARELAAKLVAQLRLIAPGAELPDLPAPRGRPSGRAKREGSAAPAAQTAPAAGAPAPSGPGLLSSLSQRQRQLIAVLLGGGILVIVVVLIATGAFEGDDGSSNGGGGGQAEQTTAGNITRAVLTPLNGGSAKGVAIFGRVRNVPVLDISVTGLEPSPSGRKYVIWLYRNDRAAFPVSAETVGSNGRLRGQAPLSTEALSLIQQGTFDSVDISLSSTDEVSNALQDAQRKLRDLVNRLDRNPNISQKQAKQLLANADTDIVPDHSGTSVLRGPIVGPAVSGAGSASGNEQG